MAPEGGAPTAPQPPLQLAEPPGRDRLGTVRVANEVVAWIAALAALEVTGVHAMYQTGAQQIDRILRRPVAHRGVKVVMQPDDTLQIDVHVVMEAGADLPEMGAEVQRRVARAIEKMLGLDLTEVNVYVNEVVFS
jgi:uncharacterized alkaline shock family protein YloU